VACSRSVGWVVGPSRTMSGKLGRGPGPAGQGPGHGLRQVAHPVPAVQTGSRMSPPWAETAQITKMSRVMMSSDQNG
jgi:hypothetical protein